MSLNNDNKIRKTLLTPCRRVGLKRKSLNCTPNTSYDFSGFRSPCTSNTNTTVSTSSAECDTTNTTPVRHRNENLGTRQSSGKRLKVRSRALDNVSMPEPLEDVSMIEYQVEKGENNDTDYEKYEENDIDSLIEKITKRISEKKTEIEKQEFDSKNVKQHNLANLNSLIDKWRLGCQTALKDLSLEYQKRDANLTMPVLLKQLGIPYELVHYSETEMDFQK